MSFPTQHRLRVAAALVVWLLAWRMDAGGAQHALIAGVWDYDAPGLALDAPRNDLILMRDLLAGERYDSGSLTVLENPTKEALVTAFEAAA